MRIGTRIRMELYTVALFLVHHSLKGSATHEKHSPIHTLMHPLMAAAVMQGADLLIRSNTKAPYEISVLGYRNDLGFAQRHFDMKPQPPPWRETRTMF